jgi:predicted AAA+ superfamily ATPase
MTLLPRNYRAPDTSYFLFGPRGTGKSSWLKVQYPDALWIDLLEASQFRSFSAYPERLEEQVELYHNTKKVVVIDEIQRAVQLLPVTHRLIENYPDVKFVLTGSSPRKLRAQGIDLLGGRAALSWMHPFIAAELREGFDLPKALSIGMLPLIWSSANPQQTLEGYIGLYLEQEIRAEGLVRKLDSFSRFLEVISFSHGQVLSLSSIARDSEVKRSTAEGFLDILESLLIGKRIPVFTKRAKRATVNHCKFYLFDCGVYRTLRPSGPLDRPEELLGQALEGLVFQHLQAWLDYSSQQDQLYYWRTSSGIEVDFIVYGPNTFWAIEVKNTNRIRPEDLRSLKIFGQDYPEATLLFLYRGEKTTRIDSVVCMPVDWFLRNLNPSTPLSIDNLL